MSEFGYYEFFAGGGMARAGLGDHWNCLFANDFDPKKVAAYAANWGSDRLLCEDVAKVSTACLPGKVDLAWASFPCQDLSLAGAYAGLGRASANTSTRSGTFWPFWSLMKALKRENRAPKLVVLENVYGVLTSHQGQDFAAIGRALAGSGYKFGAIVVDAIRFVPQSRPRVFIVAAEETHRIPSGIVADAPSLEWHPRALIEAQKLLSAADRKKWIWWQLPVPRGRTKSFSDLIEDQPTGVKWHSPGETARLLDLMSPVNRAKVETARRARRRMVGAVYKRTRRNADGVKQQRAEVRFDNVAGCLRTPSGGSSRQTIILVENNSVRSRLLSAREAARLMGLPENYKLPARYNDAYHVAGDGVCVPAVRYIAAWLLEPVLQLGIAKGHPLAAAE